MKSEEENGYWITDWSGVISDDRSVVYMINKGFSADYGFPMLNYQEWVSDSKPNVIEFLRSQGIEISEEDKEEIWKKHEYMLDKLENIGFRPTIYPGAKEFLNYLKEKEKSIIVVSSHPQSNVEDEMEWYGVENLIDKCRGSCEDKHEKLRTLCEDFKIDPEETPYCGDMSSDIEAAKEVGMISIAVATGYHSKEDLKRKNPDLLADDLEEVREEIERCEGDLKNL